MAKKEKAPKEEKDAKPEEKDAKKGAEGKEGEAPAEGAEGEAAPKKSKKKLIIIIAAAVLVLGGGAGAFIALSGGDDKKAEKGEKGEHGEEGEEHGDAKDGEKAEAGDVALDEEGKPILGEDGKPMKAKPVFYDVPDIIVNLNSSSPRPHFVNLKLTLEIANEKKLEDVKTQLPRITDSFNTYLREVRREDLQGSAGTYRLKKELTTRLEKILGENVVKEVLIREIIVQ